MKNQRKTEIKVGLTVVIGLLLLVWILGWAKNVSVLSEKKILKIEFDNAAGLAPGDAVMVNGVRKGKVESVTVSGSGVLVSAALDPDVKLKRDAQFSIMMLDLMGGKKIEISPGSEEQPLDFSKVQHGTFKGDIATAMAALSSVQSDLIEVIQEIKFALKETNSFLKDEEFKADLKNTVVNLSSLTKGLNTLIAENREGLKDLINNGNKLASSADSLLAKNGSNFTQLIAGSKSFVEKSNAVLDSVNLFLSQTRAKKNNLGKALYDKTVLKNLAKSIERINKLTKVLLEQLKSEGINVDAKIDIF